MSQFVSLPILFTVLGAVDLTPWKYRHIVCIIGIILAIGIYILFSPIGIAA